MSPKEKLKQLLATTEPAELGPGPRSGVQTETELNQAVSAALGAATIPPAKQQLLRALLLLWHDKLEPAHVLAQQIENPDGAFVHGIMHRREPDFGNAKYWFRHVGRHPAFEAIARLAGELKNEPALLARLIPNGQWDPFAFIDACQEASHKPAHSNQTKALRELQRIETESLLDYFCGE